MPFYSVSDVGLGIYSIHEQMEHHPDEVYEWNRYINNFRMKNLFLCITKYLLEVLFASFRIISWKLSDFSCLFARAFPNNETFQKLSLSLVCLTNNATYMIRNFYKN